MRQVALFLLWSIAASAQTAKPEESSTIEGRVLHAVTGVPVGKVSLFLVPIDSTPAGFEGSYATSSDSTGKFVIPKVDPGKYRLRASRNGFVTIQYGGRSFQRSGTVLDLDRPRKLKDVELRLTPQGVVAGRVLDTDGEPLPGVRVELLRSQYVNGKKVLATTNTTYTNDLGEYRWAGLTRGKYFICAENTEGLPPASLAKEEYVPVYYADAASTAGAIPIDVAAGAQLRLADVMLRKALTATVKGRVVVGLPDARGIPSVRFFPKAGHNNSAAASFRTPPAKVNVAGGFEIRNLTPGSYIVMAEISKGNRGYTGRTMLEVAGADIEGVIVSIGSGVPMAGRIRVDGDAAQDFHNVSVRLLRGGPTLDSISVGSADRIAQDRTFKIDNLDPDRYGVLIDGLPDGFYIKSIRVGDADVMYSGVDLTHGTPGQVDILVSPKAGTVSGVARNPNTGQPAPGATVVLVPKGKERVAIPALYRQSASDQNGHFALRSVAPGEYQVYAWEDVESTAWLDPEFMKPLEAKGVSITVGESAQADVQVNIIPADSET